MISVRGLPFKLGGCCLKSETQGERHIIKYEKVERVKNMTALLHYWVAVDLKGARQRNRWSFYFAGWSLGGNHGRVLRHVSRPVHLNRGRHLMMNQRYK